MLTDIPASAAFCSARYHCLCFYGARHRHLAVSVPLRPASCCARSATTCVVHALSYSVLRIRMPAVLFGGGCAGLAGAYLPLTYTPFFIPGITWGRGRIALALVVFVSWRPGRLVIGGVPVRGGEHFGARPAAAPARCSQQVMNMPPYLATVVVLVRFRGRAVPPGSSRLYCRSVRSLCLTVERSAYALRALRPFGESSSAVVSPSLLTRSKP